MQIFKNKYILGLAVAFISLASCKKDVIATYDVNDVDIEDKSLIKDRSKSNKQLFPFCIQRCIKKQYPVIN